jgi:delta 1-pyrroline-5-carboxylate dehydrogenase
MNDLPRSSALHWRARAESASPHFLLLTTTSVIQLETSEKTVNFTRLNPMTGAVASSAPAMQASDILTIAAKAGAAFPAWAATGPNARRAVLMKAAAELENRKDAFVAAMMSEIGATAGWAMFNLGLAASMVREAAALTTQIAGEVIPSDKPGCLAMALREPVGVILGIAPWNAPIILGVRAIAVPLACGNSVILKASEASPRTHALIIEAFAEAGFPEGGRQCRDQRAGRCWRGGRRADRSSGGQAHQFHRLDGGWQDHRQACGRAFEARAARAGRQGAAHRAGGCGH